MPQSPVPLRLHRLAAQRLAVVSLFAITTATSEPAAATPYPFVGEVIAVANNFCPSLFLPLNGQLLSTATYGELFDLIGTKYGGNGSSNFALPTVHPTRTATGEPVLYCIAVDDAFPVPVPN